MTKKKPAASSKTIKAAKIKNKSTGQKRAKGQAGEKVEKEHKSLIEEMEEVAEDLGLKSKVSSPRSSKNGKARTGSRSSEKTSGNSVSEVKGSPPRRVSIRQVVFDLFESQGAANVSVEQAAKAAKAVKPDSKFDKWHLYFYRKQYNRSEEK